jgi:hypothetical protein
LGDLPPSVSRLHAPPALWFAYANGGFDGKALAELDRLGYVRIIHSPYTGPLYLDLFVRSQARLGQPLAINSRFLGQSRAARGWTLPAGSAFSRRPGVTGRTLVLPSPGVGESAAVTGAPGMVDHMYFLTFRARAASRAATMRAFLICSTSTGSFLNVAPNGGGATLPPDTVWHTVRTAVVCPAGTTWLRVDLRASGRSHILFRNVRLVGRAPDTVSGPGG